MKFKSIIYILLQQVTKKEIYFTIYFTTIHVVKMKSKQINIEQIGNIHKINFP
jgi:hypothetical protein